MKTYQTESFALAYKKILEDLLKNPDYIVSPRAYKSHELTNVLIEILDPKLWAYTNMKRGTQLKYCVAEFAWYFAGRNDADFIIPHAKFWDSIKNDDGTINSSYGYLLFNKTNEHNLTQYNWAISQLKEDKDTRQAVMHLNLPMHQYFYNKDFVCTMSCQAMIRDNKLHFSVNMRSNDAILGLPTDIAFFCVLQQQMLFHLKQYYPNLKLGTYAHHVGSLHVYEKHFKLIDEMLCHKFTRLYTPLVDCELVTETGQPNEISKLENFILTKQKDITNSKFIKWCIEEITT